MEYLSAYQSLIAAMGATGVLMFVQFLASDFAGLAKGHTPGHTVKPDHDHFHFRASRTIANSNEGVGIFILFALVGILSGADPKWMGLLAWGYVAFRITYTLSYWLNYQKARTFCFIVSFAALSGMGITMILGLTG